MHGRVTATRNLLNLLAPSLLLILWSVQVIGSGGLLAGLGGLALLGYLTDRGGRTVLLVPAGLLLGLGIGLIVSDLAVGSSLGWAAEVGCFGLGLLGIYGCDRRQTWALAFGGILLWIGLGWGLFHLAPPLGLLILALPIVLSVAGGWAWAGGVAARERRSRSGRA